MLIDLHMHEATFSPDSFLRLEDMVATAQKIGLEGICITDHDSMGLRKKAESYSKRIGYPIFVGVEYYSLQGDIVAFGVEEVPKRRLPAQEFIGYVHRQGGVCFAAHPYRSNNRGLGDNLPTAEGLDGVEAFNASTDFEANLRALAVCESRGIQALGVSDCHVMNKIGVYATHLPGRVHNLPEFIAAFRRNLCYPVGLLEGRYVNLLPIAKMMTHQTALLPETAFAFHPKDSAGKPAGRL